MADELKATVINMKSLNQNIPDPVIVGAGDANGRTLRIIFTQEAAAQMTEDTKVYLSWYHQEIDVKGYNVFTHIVDDNDDSFPPTWEIKYPKSMLYEGNVLACIQLVDNVSIATSTNFTIHVLLDPNDGSRYTASDDFTEFQKAVISLATLSDEMQRQMANQKIEFEDMQLEFLNIQQVVQDANSAAEQAREIADQSLQTAQNALNTITDLTDIAREARDIAQANEENVSQLEEKIVSIEERLDQNDDIVAAVRTVADSALEIARAIDEKECGCGGMTSEEIETIIAENITETKTDLTNQIQEVETRLTSNFTETTENLTNELDDTKETLDNLLAILTITDFT